MDWLVTCSETLCKLSFSKLLIILWSIWKERNQRLWNDKLRSMHALYYQTTNYLVVLQSVRSIASVRHRQIRPWLKPSAGWIKINIDGAFDQVTHCGGVGAVVRDSDGSVLGGLCMKINHVYSPEIVEAEAGRMACEFAFSHHLSMVVFESDCQKLVQTSTIEFFSHTYRESNVMAHSVVRFGLANNISCNY